MAVVVDEDFAGGRHVGGVYVVFVVLISSVGRGELGGSRLAGGIINKGASVNGDY